MASIVTRGKKYSVVYYNEKGEQKWTPTTNYSQATKLKDKYDQEAKERKEKKKAEKAAFLAREKEVGKKKAQEEANNKITVTELLEDVFKKYGYLKWGPSQYTSSENLKNNYIDPYFGDNKVVEVNVKTVDDYYSFLLTEAEPVANLGRKAKTEHLTPNNIIEINKLMKTAFNLAIKWEIINKNPFKYATLPEIDPEIRNWLTMEQVDYFLEMTSDPTNYDDYMLHCAVNTVINCTVRGGEIGGAQWNRFDDEGKKLYNDRVLDRVPKKLLDLKKLKVYFQFPDIMLNTKTVKVLKEPKTKTTIRYIHFTDTVFDELTQLRNLQNQIREEFGPDGYADYDLIFCQANGRPLMTEMLNKRFKDKCGEIGLPTDCVFHSLRTTATIYKLILSGGDIRTVMDDGGWAEPDMVLKQYNRIQEASRKTMAEKMEKDFYHKSKAKHIDFSKMNIVEIKAYVDESPAALKIIAKDYPDLAKECIATYPDLLIHVLSAG